MHQLLISVQFLSHYANLFQLIEPPSFLPTDLHPSNHADDNGQSESINFIIICVDDVGTYLQALTGFNCLNPRVQDSGCC
jgi:hypothetical protein